MSNIKTWTTQTKVTVHGNSLVANITEGCRQLGLNRGDIIKITVERANTLRYAVRVRESGDVIDYFDSLEYARKAVRSFEYMDKMDRNFEPNFYEIYDVVSEEIIE